MSIPIYFAAVRDKRRDVFVDGGVFDNYPIKLFDRVKYIDKVACPLRLYHLQVEIGRLLLLSLLVDLTTSSMRRGLSPL